MLRNSLIVSAEARTDKMHAFEGLMCGILIDTMGI